MTDTMKKLAVLLIGTLFVLCVAIVLAVSLPVSTAFAAEGEPEATVHDHADGTWTELTATGGTLQSGNYYLTSDVTLTTNITVAEGTTVTLCLNGYKLTGTGTDSVITVSDDASFTLTDCRSASEEAECQHSYYVAESGLWTFYDGDLPEAAPDGAETGVVTGGVITGGNGLYGGVYADGGTFTMDGGTISGNTAEYGGGGVYVSGGTFTMKDGAITNNIASNNNKRGGGGVFVGGTFTMEGGTISGNTATNGSGGGVNVYNSSDSMFNMTGGYLGDNTATESGNDIYKDEAGVVSISGGYFSENPDAAYIADGHTAQDISALGGATFDGDYKDGFPYAVYAQGGILISTNKDIVYDGSPVAEGVDFTVEGTDGVEFTYLYKTAGDEFTAGLPTNAGDYTVYVYALNGEKQFISMVFDITIAKADYDMSDITFEDGSFTYDGQAHSLVISGTLPTGVSVTYAGNDKTNAGEYTVTATFVGDYDNYIAIPDITATLTIAKAAPAYTAPTDPRRLGVEGRYGSTYRNGRI